LRSQKSVKPAPRPDGKDLEYVELYNSNPWFHDISGYRLVGQNLNYTLPAGTVIPGGGYLVLAAAPGDVSSTFGLEKVLGPYQGAQDAR
jgi:hypothetical protein